MTLAVVYVEQCMVIVVQSCDIIFTYNMEIVNNDDNASVIKIKSPKQPQVFKNYLLINKNVHFIINIVCELKFRSYGKVEGF